MRVRQPAPHTSSIKRLGRAGRGGNSDVITDTMSNKARQRDAPAIPDNTTPRPLTILSLCHSPLHPPPPLHPLSHPLPSSIQPPFKSPSISAIPGHSTLSTIHATLPFTNPTASTTLSSSTTTTTTTTTSSSTSSPHQ
ncbi:hypothetical protein E2C01_085783 [Portunus trituberculatus]|uniref:Uncharacterized protein n=1 Tax=Portunus trituberculatus TaxID=210409 RepID=A0A5B7J8H7_PORTR|nr:hypothetical protein [Portunus trituberculatus]